MKRRRWWGRLITGGRWELCELYLFALVCDISLFTSRINAWSSEGPNGGSAERAPHSVVGDVLSSQMFSCSFHISKDNCAVQQSFFPPSFLFNGDTVGLQCFSPRTTERLEQMKQHVPIKQDEWRDYKQKFESVCVSLSTEQTSVFKHWATLYIITFIKDGFLVNTRN